MDKGLFKIINEELGKKNCEEKNEVCVWYYKTQRLIREKKPLRYEECKDCDGNVDNACERYITLEAFREFYNRFF